MANIVGQRATAGTNAIQSARRIVDMHDKIMLLEPSKNPLSLLASAMSRKSVINPEFKVLEDVLVAHNTRVNNSGGYTAGATSIIVDDGTVFPLNSILIVQRTGETMHVTARSTNTLTVTRSWGTVAAAALVDNDQVTCLGGAAAEGASSESSLTTQETSGTNYTQIFRWPFEVTGTDMASDLYGGSDMGLQRRKGSIEFAKRLDLAFFFGEKVELTSGSTARRTTGGLKEFISTNTKNMGGGFNYVTFLTFSNDFFRYGSKDKVLFASRKLAQNIALDAMSAVERVESATSYGIEINRLVTQFGRLRMIVHDGLDGDEYDAVGFIVDLENIGYRYLRGRDVKLKTNIQAPDVDSEKDEVFGEIGLFRSLEKTHAYISNAG